MNKILKTNDRPFINAAQAIMALQAAQAFYGLAGYLTTSRISTGTNSVELTIHFNTQNYLPLPGNYSYSKIEIDSRSFWSENLNQELRVRTMTISYLFN